MTPSQIILTAKACALLVVLAFVYWLGGQSGRTNLAEYKAKVATDHLKELAAADDRTASVESKLAAALAKRPQTGRKVADAVRDNPAPADCVVPDAVIDSLQEGIDSGRSATR